MKDSIAVDVARFDVVHAAEDDAGRLGSSDLVGGGSGPADATIRVVGATLSCACVTFVLVDVGHKTEAPARPRVTGYWDDRYLTAKY